MNVKSTISQIKNSNSISEEKKAMLKNSFWQVATTVLSKTSSIFFTIIIARLMSPEIYGLYGLALSTILFVGVMSDLGIGSAIIIFVSKTIDNNPGKSKGYLKLLTKYKLFLTLLSSLLLLTLSRWLASSYYNKPIYYALIAGAIYLPISAFSSHLVPVFMSKNNFKNHFFSETIIQISRLVILPLSIIFFLSKMQSTEIYLFWTIIILSICYLLGGIYLLLSLNKQSPFRRKRAKPITKKERRQLLRFILPLSATSLSGVFFGHIDKIMLGGFVEGQFLGYYQAAFNLIVSAAVIISFSSSSSMPIFSRMSKEKLESGFKRIRNIIFIISSLALIFSILVAPLIIRLVYGQDYMTAVTYLRYLSPILISMPMIGLYSSYYISQKRTKLVSVSMIVSTALNVGLNYIFISWGSTFSSFYAVVGACAATIISKYIYLLSLIIGKNYDKK